MVWSTRSRISCPTAWNRVYFRSLTSRLRRARFSTPPVVSTILPMPRNGARRSLPRGSTRCWHCCSKAWKRRVSADPLCRARSPRRYAKTLEPRRISPALALARPCLGPRCGPEIACCLTSIKSGTSLSGTDGAEENVLLALFADIHANQQAFSACLEAARARGAERMICLGDVVGYGADPEWTVETVMDLVDRGAMAVRGNHDSASRSASETMNAEAQAAIEWTRGRLSVSQRRFLAELPLTRRDDDRLYVHSEASHPARWRYVQSTPDAARSLEATEAHITFCGHIHQPALYSMSSAAKMTSFVPASGIPVQLLGGRRWLAVMGSGGEPSDGNPAASFAMFDTSSQEITYWRVPYDVETAAERIVENGLPLWLADRL